FEALGITFDNPEALGAAFERFKDLADKKHEIFDEDLQALVSDVRQQEVTEIYQLGAMTLSCKTGISPHVELTLGVRGEPVTTTASGSGPVDATYKAIEKVVASGATLKLYSVNAITQGT